MSSRTRHTSLSQPPSDFIAFAHSLALASGQCIMRHYRTGVSVEYKADNSPVTIADKEAEELIRESIMKEYPAHGIIGEEFGSENWNAEYTWVIDPIDGTKSFISGTPLFGTLIALAHQGTPILGIIHLPALQELYTGTNDAADCNGTSIHLRECDALCNAVLLTTDHRDAESVYGSSVFHEVVSKSRFYRTWGDCYGYSLLCSGYADIMLDPVLAPWDMFALLPIIKGAGGIVTDNTGGNPLESGNIVAAHSGLHSKVLHLLSGSPR